MQTVALVLTNCTSGGTVRHVFDMIDAWKRQKKTVMLIAEWHDFIAVVVWKNDGTTKRYPLFARSGQWHGLIKLLQRYNVGLIHVHHLLHARKDFFYLPEQLNVPYVVTLHDYYAVCPLVTLTDEEGKYCGESGIDSCNVCLSKRRWTNNISVNNIQEWRKYWHVFLKNAVEVIIPSNDMFKRINKYFDDVKLRIFENPELIKIYDEKRIGIIGSLDKKKGAERVKDILSLVAEYKLPLKFILWGQLTNIFLTKEEKKYIEITGEYNEKEVYGKIKEKGIDFFWFPGICPETYSYTLTVPIKLGLPCIANDIGAIADRIKENNWGDVYDFFSESSEIVEALLKFDYKKYKKNDFKIKNISFGDFDKFYKSVAMRKNDKVPPKVSVENFIQEPAGYLNDIAFKWCWGQYGVYGKLKLLLCVHKRSIAFRFFQGAAKAILPIKFYISLSNAWHRR